jgi:hypothetical protein
MYGYDSDEKPPQYYSDNPLNKIKMMCAGGKFESNPPIQLWYVEFMDGTKQDHFHKLDNLDKIEGLTEEDKKAIVDFTSIIDNKIERDEKKRIYDNIQSFSKTINHIKFKKQFKYLPKYETTNNDNIIRSINFGNYSKNCHDLRSIVDAYGFCIKFNDIQKQDLIIYCDSKINTTLLSEIELEKRIKFYDNILIELPISIDDYICYFNTILDEFRKLMRYDNKSDDKFHESIYFICDIFINHIEIDKEKLLIMLHRDYLRLLEITKNKKKVDECRDKLYGCENIYSDLIYTIQSNCRYTNKPSIYGKITKEEKYDIEKYFLDFIIKHQEYYKILDEPINDELIPYIEKAKIIGWDIQFAKKMKYVMPEPYTYESIDETNKIKKINCEFIKDRDYPNNYASIDYLTTIKFNDELCTVGKYYDINKSVLNQHCGWNCDELIIKNLFRTNLATTDIFELEKLFEIIQNNMDNFELEYSFHNLAYFVLEEKKLKL